MDPVAAALLGLVAYGLGMFPSAQLIARANGLDITKVGSGNPGASNVTRALGWRKGIWVFVLDAAKGAVATGLGLWLLGRPGAYALGALAILGHVYPVLRRGRGGKGVATGGGVIMVAHPLMAPLAIGLWWIVSKITGKAALGSIVSVSAVPLGLLATGVPVWEVAATLALCALIMARHLSNLKRLVRRQEHGLRTPVNT
jgi:glycerol-3-phosphate acyltransferase PlsY